MEMAETQERKSIFKSIELVNLPYFPFEPGTKLEARILDFISNSIMKIQRTLRRQIESYTSSKIANFHRSETLIGIDISSLSDREVTYLESLTNVIYLFPFILINSSFEEKRLKTLRLHKMLVDKGYILPCLPRVSPADILSTGERYGSEFLDLIKGTIPELEARRLKNFGICYTAEDLLSRFDRLKFDGQFLRYEMNVHWLGVEDAQIARLLDRLFNQNTETFHLAQKCDEFGVDETNFRRYLEGMLFDETDNNHPRFRFTRQNIIPAVKGSLNQEFENKQYERSVIDTSDTDYKDFKGTFVEYHDLGKLFDPNETFSIKMITHIKQQFERIDFTKIILIDNGYEDNLRILISEIFSAPVSRIINNLGQPQLYPFDKFDFYEKILIITDLCNTGNFLHSVIDFVENEFKFDVVGVYSFIINPVLDINRLRTAGKGGGNFLFKYYVEKTLHDVSKISKKRQISRRQKSSSERFLFFWDSINQLGAVKAGFFSSGARSGEFFKEIKDVTSIYFQQIQLSEHADKTITPHADLAFFIKDLVEEHKFTGCILHDTPSARAFSRILMRINSNIKLKFTSFSVPSDDSRSFYKGESSVLIYDDGLNAGQELLKFIRFLGKDEDILTRNCLSIFTLFSRADALKKNEYLKLKFRQKLTELVNNRMYIYYVSDLPFYILLESDEEDRRLKAKLEGARG
jgi:hypothetical protein